MDRIIITARHRYESGNSLILGNSVRVEVDDRNESNIEALERCNKLDDIFSVFGYSESI